MTLQQRIDAYARTFPERPPMQLVTEGVGKDRHEVIYGRWLIGQNYARKFGCNCGIEILPSNHEANDRSSNSVRCVQQGADDPKGVAEKAQAPTDVFTPLQRRAKWAGVGEARPQGSSSLDSSWRGVVQKENEQREPPTVDRGSSADPGWLSGSEPAKPPEGEGQRLCHGARSSSREDARAATTTRRGGASQRQEPVEQRAGKSSSVRVSSRPLAIGTQGSLRRCWACGAAKEALYGSYPPGYLDRIAALFPDVVSQPASLEAVLHVFSGSLPPGPYARCDLRQDAEFHCSVYDLPALIDNQFDLILADPPYSKDDAKKYGTPMVNRGPVLHALAQVTRPGGHLVWLDTVWPMHRKSEWRTVGRIALTRSTNHRLRDVTIFERWAA